MSYISAGNSLYLLPASIVKLRNPHNSQNMHDPITTNQIRMDNKVPIVSVLNVASPRQWINKF
jgi:hypothetical protein